jgi:hypothetical protein
VEVFKVQVEPDQVLETMALVVEVFLAVAAEAEVVQPLIKMVDQALVLLVHLELL